MKNFLKNKKNLALILLGIALVVGLATYFFAVKGKSSNEFSKAERDDFVKEFKSMVVDRKLEPYILMDKLEGNIERLPQTDRDDAVDGVMYCASLLYDEYSLELKELEDKLLELAKQGLDLNSPDILPQIEDLALNEFLQKVQRNLYVLILDEDKLHLSLDFQELLDRYGHLLSPYFTDYLKFYLSEQQTSFFTKDGLPNMDELIRRILQTEDYLNKYENSYYANAILKSNSYYMQILLGWIDYGIVFDESSKLYGNMYDIYVNTIKKYPTSVLARKLSTLLEKLEDNNFYKNDDVEMLIIELAGVEYQEVGENVKLDTVDPRENPFSKENYQAFSENVDKYVKKLKQQEKAKQGS